VYKFISIFSRVQATIIINSYFTGTVASSTVNDYVTDLVRGRIFNTNAQYSSASFKLKIDEKQKLMGFHIDQTPTP